MPKGCRGRRNINNKSNNSNNNDEHKNGENGDRSGKKDSKARGGWWCAFPVPVPRSPLPWCIPPVRPRIISLECAVLFFTEPYFVPFFLIQNRAEISKRFAQGCRYTRWQRKFPVNDPAMVQQARVRESWAFLSAARHVSYIVICICADWQNGKNQRNTQTDLRKLRRFASHIARTLAISWHCSLVIGFVRGHLFSLTYIPI